MAISIGKTDPRYQALEQGNNLRWPASPDEAPGSIELCESAGDVVAALQDAVDSGKRPTIRSGGHCYEDFAANNPGGVMLDLSLLTDAHLPNDGGRYRIAAGQRLGDVYTNLFKRYGVMIPAGSCTGVGAGGHISGGGYGVLSRLHGLTVDWLSAVEIVTINEKGKAELLRVDKTAHADLFRACRGGGGGNFGIITGFLCDKLPPAPKEIAMGGLSFNWPGMTEARFVDIVLKFGEYFQTRGKDEDTWGLYAALDLSHSAGGRLGVSVLFCNPDGTCGDLSVVQEFLDRFEDCDPTHEHIAVPGAHIVPQNAATLRPCPGKHALNKAPWFEATVQGGAGRKSRAKYKSTYMKENFTAAEAKCIYKHLKTPMRGVKAGGAVLAVGSYGGAVNRPGLAAETSIHQRSSTMKLQFQTYWSDPQEDAGHLQWMSDFYTDLYSGETVPRQYEGTPYPGKHYEGCYINYPDADMLKYPFWPQLYYGEGELYVFLQDVKKKYDPHNVFHHAMSIRPRES